MDLGIAGRRAIVGGASKGLGRACAAALAAEGVRVVAVARTAETLEATAREIAAATGSDVTPVAADLSTAEGRAAVLAACPDPDILVNNAGGPPPGDFRDWDRDTWIKALDMNMFGAIELIRATIDGMIARRFGRVVNITSAAVKAPIPVLGLSNAARAGLTGFCSGLARQVAGHNVTINFVLPGQFDTDRMKGTHAHLAAQMGVTTEQLRAGAVKQIPAGRFGDPAEFGASCAFLCGAQAGFITAQNILLDGGQYPGLL